MLVANFWQLDVSRGTIDDGVGLQRQPAEVRGMSTRPGPGPVRLAPGTPGTPVTVVSDGRTRAGVVQPYEPENTLTHTFPVRFTETGQWRQLTARDVTVVQPEERPVTGPLAPTMLPRHVARPSDRRPVAGRALLPQCSRRPVGLMTRMHRRSAARPVGIKPWLAQGSLPRSSAVVRRARERAGLAADEVTDFSHADRRALRRAALFGDRGCSAP